MNNENNYVIYMHKNKINGKVYIGQTGMNLNRRFKSGYGYKSSPHFYSAIQKYGWDNFEHLILEKNLSSKEANDREKFWIAFFNSTDQDFGYNIASGGKTRPLGNNGVDKKCKPCWCKETGQYFESITAAALWLGKPKEFASNISANIKGLKKSAGKHPETGITLHWTDNENNINSANKEIKKPGAKMVKNLDTGEIFQSVNDAAARYNISNITISKSCKLKGKIATGGNKGPKYHWIFVQDL